MFKVNNKDTRMTPSVSIVDFGQVIAGWIEAWMYILSEWLKERNSFILEM